MKYIHCPNLGIVIFEGHVMHADMAARLGCHQPLSAGFVRADGRLECYGESVSLDVTSAKGDTLRLNAFIQPAEKMAS